MSISWRVRPERSEDVESVRQLMCRAFPTSYEAELLDKLRQDPDWIDALSLVATDADDRVTGYAVMSRGSLVDDSSVALPVAVLSHVAVLPEQQGKGVGTAVVKQLIEETKQRGEKTIVVLGHKNYYPRFGFVPAHRFGIRFPKELKDKDCFMVLPLSGAEETSSRIVKFAKSFDLD